MDRFHNELTSEKLLLIIWMRVGSYNNKFILTSYYSTKEMEWRRGSLQSGGRVVT